METDRIQKIFFKLDASDWHGHASESLWGSYISSGLYQMMNSPFFYRGVSNKDIVRTQSQNDEIEYLEVVERGGHSTFMLLIDQSAVAWVELWKAAEIEGCRYESGIIKLSIGTRLLYSVDVPREVDLGNIIEIFSTGEKEGAWVYQEGYRYS